MGMFIYTMNTRYKILNSFGPVSWPRKPESKVVMPNKVCRMFVEIKNAQPSLQITIGFGINKNKRRVKIIILIWFFSICFFKNYKLFFFTLLKFFFHSINFCYFHQIFFVHFPLHNFL